MDFFEFVLILVSIITLGEIVKAVGAPLVDKLGDVVKELAARRDQSENPLPAPAPELVDELEDRIARIEDRLDFIEELRAPERRAALHEGRGPDRAPGADEAGIARDPAERSGGAP